MEEKIKIFKSTLQREIDEAQKRFDKSLKDENYSDAARHEAYLHGVQMAQTLIKVCTGEAE